jgi:hypothetical protein
MSAEVDRTAVGSAIPDHFVAEIVHVVQSKREAPDGMKVRELVEREWPRYDDARVRTFVPVLVRRAVIGQLRADPDSG